MDLGLEQVSLGKASNKISKELLDKLVDFRNSLLLHTDRENYFGRLVYDTKNKEYGIIIGPFTSIIPEKKGKKRLLLVTMGDEDFRVRYTEQHSVKYLKDCIDDITWETSKQSINYFCKEQCIMECSDQCALFKFKNKHD